MRSVLTYLSGGRCRGGDGLWVGAWTDGATEFDDKVGEWVVLMPFPRTAPQESRLTADGRGVDTVGRGLVSDSGGRVRGTGG